MTNESASDQKISTITHDNVMMKGQHGIELTTLSVHHDVAASESYEKENRENGKIQLTNESLPSIAWNEVVQVIAKRTKHKRSDTSREQRQQQDGDEGNEMDVEQFEIPIDSDSSDAEMTNEHPATVEGGVDNEQRLNERIDWTSDDDVDDARWFTKHRILFANLSENHRQRKQKFVRLVMSLLTPKLSNNTSNVNNLKTSHDDKYNDDDDDVTFVPSDDESKLSFSIMRGNSTVIHVTPKQFLRMFHRGSDEHAELQTRTKTMLQRAFYKYARIYLQARKGYKDVRSFNRMVKEHHQEHDEASTTSHEFLPTPIEQHQEANKIDDDDEDFDDALTFMTSDASRNVQTIEALAIYLLEIFGALYAISFSAVWQIQNAYFNTEPIVHIPSQD
jgi:hypothetical protein